jgi:hypothetical protein
MQAIRHSDQHVHAGSRSRFDCVRQESDRDDARESVLHDTAQCWAVRADGLREQTGENSQLMVEDGKFSRGKILRALAQPRKVCLKRRR